MTAPYSNAEPADTPALRAPGGAEAVRARTGTTAATVAAWTAFAAGVGLRFDYIFRHNQPMDHLFSDMKGYYDRAQDFCNPEYIPSIADTVHPPGGYYYFGMLMKLDRTFLLGQMDLLGPVQFAGSVLAVLLVAGIAYELFGRRVALVALAMASLYYPLWDYFGFLLTEGPFMVCLLLSFWLLLRSLRSKGAARGLYGLFAGTVLGCAAGFKSVALPTAFLVFVALLAAVRLRRLPRGTLTITAATLGLLLILTPLAVRATNLTNDEFAKRSGKFHFCLIANDASRNIMMGHYGRIGAVEFQDPDRALTYIFGSPSAAQNGYGRDGSSYVVKVGVYDNSKLLAMTLDWVSKHPVEALQLSFDHMFDLFFGTYGWPSSAMPQNHGWVRTFAQIFLVFVLLPACIVTVQRWREMVRLKPEAFGELLLVLPLIGLAFVAFLSLGEPRYRIPYDGFLLVLAARFYCGRHPGDRAPITVAEPDALTPAEAPGA